MCLTQRLYWSLNTVVSAELHLQPTTLLLLKLLPLEPPLPWPLPLQQQLIQLLLLQAALPPAAPAAAAATLSLGEAAALPAAAAVKRGGKPRA